MSYLVDTDYLVSFLNGRGQAVELLDRLAGDGISVSIITCAIPSPAMLGTGRTVR